MDNLIVQNQVDFDINLETELLQALLNAHDCFLSFFILLRLRLQKNTRSTAEELTCGKLCNILSGRVSFELLHIGALFLCVQEFEFVLEIANEIKSDLHVHVIDVSMPEEGAIV